MADRPDRAHDERPITLTPSRILVVPSRFAFEGSEKLLEFGAHFPRPRE
jgi:hypothetical protein